MMQRSHKYLLFFLIIAALYALIIYMLVLYMEGRTEVYLQSKADQFKVEFRAIKESYDLLAKHVLIHDIENDAITAIMAEAARNDDAGDRERLHNQLLEELTPLYSRLKMQHIRQLHFHLPGAISFVRFHRPDKYGDSLWDIRYSIKKVNETKKSATGFEEGRVFNGFRHVYPLFHHGTFVGTVEISYSFAAVQTAAWKIFPAMYRFILEHSNIKKKVWEHELKNYEQSDLSPDYLYDSSVEKITAADEPTLISAERLKRINEIIAPKIAMPMKASKAFSIPVHDEEYTYLVNFLPIANVEGKHVAYFIAYSQDNVLDGYFKDFLYQAISVLVLLLLSGSLVLLYLRHQQHVAEKRLIELKALTDPLTGISNRAGFTQMLEYAVVQAVATSKPLSIIFFDVDHFKSINDTYGHDAGDSVLIELSKLVKAMIRENDSFSRWGGEEFVILLPLTPYEAARLLAEKIRKSIEAHPFEPTYVSCSFGVTHLHHDDTIENFIKRADTLLYRAKKEGRNRVVAHE